MFDSSCVPVAAAADPWPLVPLHNCAVHGSHRDWLSFRWSALAGVSDLYCLRCFTEFCLDRCIPAGGIVSVPGSGTGGGGGGGGGGVTPAVPTVVLSATPLTVASGGAAQLTWTTTDATTVTAGGGWSGNQAASGTASTGALTSTTTFTLTAIGAGGTAGASVTVTVGTPSPAPTLSFSANATTVNAGTAVTLTWFSGNATSVVASAGWSGPQVASGTATVTPAATTTYTLTATGAGGSVSQSVTVTVAVTPQIPTIQLTASPSTIASGAAATLTWTSTDATSVTASGGWSGAKSLNGSAPVSPASSATFTLTATGPGGTAQQSVTVTVTTGLVAQFQLVAGGFVGSGITIAEIGFMGPPIVQAQYAVGSITPNHLFAGGTATGQTILALFTYPAASQQLVLWLSYASTTSQTNQFDTVEIVDDDGVLRVFHSNDLGTGQYAVNAPSWQEWEWKVGGSPAFATVGKTYTVTFRKA